MTEINLKFIEDEVGAGLVNVELEKDEVDLALFSLNFSGGG